MNGVLSGATTGTTNFTAYISPYLVVGNGGNYTKHIYIGSQRITSKVSNSGIFATSPVTTSALQMKYVELTAKINARYDSLGVVYRGVAQTGGLVSKTPATTAASYFYHSDHLGSSSLITDGSGAVTQHLEYVPFGDVFVDERRSASSWTTPYLFSAKERDEETGLSYFGARYYDSRTSVWLSVDPLAGKYPNFSSYVYCADNPVKFIDPDGREIIPILYRQTNNRGWAIGDAFKSDVKYFNAMKSFAKTQYGREFIGSFINKGESQYGVKGNGRNADCVFMIKQYNMENPSAQGVFMRNEGSFNVYEKDGKLTFELSLNAKTLSSSYILETITHELGLHGSNYKEIIEAYKKGGIEAVNKIMNKKGDSGDIDHKDLINNNTNNSGVATYNEIKDDLIKLDAKNKTVFDNVKEEDKIKYEHLNK